MYLQHLRGKDRRTGTAEVVALATGFKIHCSLHTTHWAPTNLISHLESSTSGALLSRVLTLTDLYAWRVLLQTSSGPTLWFFHVTQRSLPE